MSFNSQKKPVVNFIERKKFNNQSVNWDKDEKGNHILSPNPIQSCDSNSDKEKGSYLWLDGAHPFSR